MSVETNNPAVVIYTANYLQDIGFKKHSAICFETQEVPNLYKDKKINIYPTFIDKNTNYEKYTKLIFENINWLNFSWNLTLKNIRMRLLRCPIMLKEHFGARETL